MGEGESLGKGLRLLFWCLVSFQCQLMVVS